MEKTYTEKLADRYNAHYAAKKTARTDRFVVVPVTDDGFGGRSPRVSTFVKATPNGCEITQGDTPCSYVISTANEIVRNLKGSMGLDFACVTEVEFHDMVLEMLAPRKAAV
jgi:hypothetical protein